MPIFQTPFILSMKIACISTFITFFVAIVLAWIFAYRKSYLTQFLSGITTLPLVLPPTVLGYYLLVSIGNESIIGKLYIYLFGSTLVFTQTAAVIAASIASLPLMIRPFQIAFESIGKEIREAAEVDGANSWITFIQIVIPLSYKGLLAGIILGFARSLGEFGATLMVAGNIPGKTQTLSIAIYDAVQANDWNTANLMVITLSGICIAIILLSFPLEKREEN
ncbi:molybdate transport system permease protein [Bacillus pakistanensis]|uniref:Molybdenum transport system permease n=1 Tax=Rossellomorea pakistanensis TaxID=992288 RepID=A0ABS2N8D8_9BACI|nr:molybdate ABC transporter permease subunit [Bacillus pakistanensis]MBM7584110.1 molybdate transport system permease protein [Bacillus pakistanensis]